MGGYSLALLLAALAGAVDAIGFLHWGGLFVSFMSGNSTILGARAAGGVWPEAGMALIVIAAFVGGVVLGELVASGLGRYAQAAVLVLVSVLLIVGTLASAYRFPTIAAAPVLSIAMGVQNAAMRRAAGISVALTYVTGTLVQAGRGTAAALLGRAPWAAVLPYIGLWSSLVGGSLLGAVAALRSTTLALAATGGIAMLLAVAVAMLVHRETT